MLIKSSQEALFVAIEMERSAIQIYERALMLADPDDQTKQPLRQQLMMILSDERQHFEQFQALYQGLNASVEEQLTLSAIASSVLFQGGLMGAVRQGMLKDTKSLLKFAANAEEKAAQTYRSFAETCEDDQAAAVLNAIASEEDKHLDALRNYSATMV